MLWFAAQAIIIEPIEGANAAQTGLLDTETLCKEIPNYLKKGLNKLIAGHLGAQWKRGESPMKTLLTRFYW